MPVRLGVSLSCASPIENPCSLRIVHQTLLLPAAGAPVSIVNEDSPRPAVNANKGPPLPDGDDEDNSASITPAPRASKRLRSV